MAPQERTMDEHADLAVIVFKLCVTQAIMVASDFSEGQRPPTKDEILLEIKTKFWDMFNRLRCTDEYKAEDIFAQEYNWELCERLLIKDYTYKDDEDAVELLNVWAYHEAKRQMKN